jgi:hypothetical protein
VQQVLEAARFVPRIAIRCSAGLCAGGLAALVPAGVKNERPVTALVPATLIAEPELSPILDHRTPSLLAQVELYRTP